MWGNDNPYRDVYVLEEEIIWADAESVTRTAWSDKRFNVTYRKDSRTGRKLAAIERSDASTYRFKEPGPHWFRNLYVDRPYRRYTKNELRKFLSDQNYEPNIPRKFPLVYWT